MNMDYLFAGFAVVWIVLFLFLGRIARQQRQLAQELDILRRERKMGSSD